MAEQRNSVFISYRRDVSQYMALALWQNLRDQEIDVFYDFESIAAGDFEKIILTQIAARPYMVPVLAPGTLNRCAEPNDPLRREIETALTTGRVLVPVHTPQFDFEDIDRYLPQHTAKALRGFNTLEIPPRFFEYAIAELVDKFLVPISLDLTEAPGEAVAAALNQAEAAEKAAPVTTSELSAEEYFARSYARSEEGNTKGAQADWDEAVRLNPGYVKAAYAWMKDWAYPPWTD